MEYRISNIQLALFGKSTINIAENEMPGLIFLRQVLHAPVFLQIASWGLGNILYSPTISNQLWAKLRLILAALDDFELMKMS